MPLRALKVLTWLACLTPAALLLWRVWKGHLGANPVETLEHDTGLRGLQLLILTLAMTPLRRLTGSARPIQLRRTLGLFAYAYVTVHFCIYLILDLGLSWTQLADDLVKRTYITLGFTALLLLTPLALTSTNGWQRRLKRRWKQLHRLVYAAVLLGGLHYLWLVKRDVREPLIYLGIIAALLALRLPPPRSWPSSWGGILRGRLQRRSPALSEAEPALEPSRISRREHGSAA